MSLGFFPREPSGTCWDGIYPGFFPALTPTTGVSQGAVSPEGLACLLQVCLMSALCEVPARAAGLSGLVEALVRPLPVVPSRVFPPRDSRHLVLFARIHFLESEPCP